jgi:AraC family transcriptional regulator of adaptative response/methylated-DNA-[protein]-cysteine methyltransferase
MMASELRVIAPVIEQIHFAIGISPVGKVLVGESANGICAVYLGKSAKDLMGSLQKQFPSAKCIDGGNGIKNTLSKVIEVIQNPQKNTDFDLDLRGTTFQKHVWQALREIPVGSTVCYSDIAEKLHNPGAVRAIASACGANNIAVIIPCHRVIRKDGSLSGYRWGVESKQALLRRERVMLTK